MYKVQEQVDYSNIDMMPFRLTLLDQEAGVTARVANDCHPLTAYVQHRAGCEQAVDVRVRTGVDVTRHHRERYVTQKRLQALSAVVKLMVSKGLKRYRCKCTRVYSEVVKCTYTTIVAIGGNDNT